MRQSKKASRGGYALFEVILAVTVFSIAVTGFVVLLVRMSDTSAAFAKDRLIQQRLETILIEAKRQSVSEMNAEIFDEVLGMQLRTYAEPLDLDNGEGAVLEDLYKLTAEASYTDAWGDQVERMFLYVYQPES